MSSDTWGTTVVSQPPRFSISSGSLPLRRSQASWTASSASLTEPSTRYLQQDLGFSPIETGVAYLPMVAMVMVAATTSSTRLLPRVGPTPLAPTGLALAAAGLVYLTGMEVGSSLQGSAP
jgi:hypothetical protein